MQEWPDILKLRGCLDWIAKTHQEESLGVAFCFSKPHDNVLGIKGH